MSKNVWERNAKWLRENMPLISKKLDEKIDETIMISSIETKVGWNIKLEKKGEFSFYIHSNFDRQNEYYLVSGNIKQEYRTLILFGFADASYLQYLKENYPYITHLIVVEPHIEVFRALLQRWDIGDTFGAFSKVSFVIGETIETAKSRVKQALATGYLVDRTAAVIGSLNYQWNFPEYKNALQEAVVESIQFSRVNQTTVRVFRELWLLNIWHNMQFGDANMEDFLGAFSGKPAIIVSAGPSLDKNIHLLQGAKKKALIIAVGSAITILESKGIQPHFRMAIDPDYLNEELFKGIDMSKVPLLYSEHLYYKILPQYKAPKVHVALGVNTRMSEQLHQLSGISRSKIESGFSVANIAANLLSFWQCNPIVFVGQDLAYTEDRLHAKGAWDNSFEEKYIVKKFARKDIYGNAVYTDPSFEGMRRIFERTISAHTELDYINATEGGVPIQGALNRKLEEVLKEWEESSCDYGKLIEDKINDISEKNIHANRKDALKQGALLFQKEMKTYLGELECCKKIGRRFLKNEQVLSEKELKQLNRMNQSLKKSKMNEIVESVFFEEFELRRAGHLRQKRGTEALTAQAQLFFLEICEKLKYVQGFLKLIGWYVRGEDFKIVVNEAMPVAKEK